MLHVLVCDAEQVVDGVDCGRTVGAGVGDVLWVRLLVADRVAVTVHPPPPCNLPTLATPPPWGWNGHLA